MRSVTRSILDFFKRTYVIIQFLTTIPLKAQIDIDEKQFGKSLAQAPFVGLLIGAILTCVFYLTKKYFPLQICVAYIIFIYIVLTGALHLDGLADTFDAVFSRRTKERMLEIMKDSAIGTMGTLAMICLLIFNGLFLYELLLNNIRVSLFLFPIAGRIGSVTTISMFSYARSGGLAKSFSDYCGKKELIYSLIFSGIVFCAMIGTNGLLITFGMFITSYLIAKYFDSKIGGITGDVAGAVCELNQLAFLIILYICLRNGVEF